MKIYTMSTKNKKCELNSCLQHVMLLCRWFGLYPVEGLNEGIPERVRFTLKSPYTCYYMISFAGQIFMAGFSFYGFLGINTSIMKLTNFLFYFSGLVNLTLMLKLAMNWPRLVKKATDIEQQLTEIRSTKRTATKTTIMAYVVMILALVEHILSKVATLNLAKRCMGETSLNASVIKHYIFCNMSFIFNYVPYNMWAAIILLCFCLQTTFLWSVSDVLIMCFSTYLTSYFQDLNNTIGSYEKKTKVPWGQLRVHYSHLAVLVKQIDSHTKAFVLLSFFSNLFFICVQLFNSLHHGYWQENICKNERLDDSALSPEFLAYYLFSFLFLVLRALMVSILAANVHSAAAEPLLALYDVPTSEYNIEVKRFQLLLRYTNIGLSGVFFYVTRKMILRVVGTIITYELVLLQFSKDDFTQFVQNNNTGVPFYYEMGQ